ncbi:hypothetical protein [Micromonospora sp. CB01531]|uniref:hypothetical protein n=1 Tax=Micromonospora sp. CB01531 TaxID=1718947 RepID=UPI000938D0A4|nr:hypothetical protein [Micromonospora sp. CB01531]OKI49274.1 hypothetical protein A6A27_35150 [Micromonospora sp. CB01531]
MTSPQTYLTEAERLVAAPACGTRGLWPRACAWLPQLALESALGQYWADTAPAVAACRSRRSQILMLSRYLGATGARRVAMLWWSLSRAGHHRSYELALTGGELKHLHAGAREVVR